MINRDRAQALFDALMKCDHEDDQFGILREIAYTINCANCPILSECKEDYEHCGTRIFEYLTEET